VIPEHGDRYLFHGRLLILGETDYWLDVIHSAEYFTDDEYQSLKEDNDELLRLLTSIIKTTKENDS
jgi:hypothetical protein